MILIDANLLVYAKMAASDHHLQVNIWLDEQLNGQTRVGLPWESLIAFVRIVSNPRIFERPLSVDGAWRQVEEWLSVPVAWIPQPAVDHRERVLALLPFCQGSSGLIHDAHLAAIAMAHGLKIFSADGDFARFPGIVWENPVLLRG